MPNVVIDPSFEDTGSSAWTNLGTTGGTVHYQAPSPGARTGLYVARLRSRQGFGAFEGSIRQSSLAADPEMQVLSFWRQHVAGVANHVLEIYVDHGDGNLIKRGELTNAEPLGVWYEYSYVFTAGPSLPQVQFRAVGQAGSLGTAE